MSVQVSYKKQTIFGIFLVFIVIVCLESIVRIGDSFEDVQETNEVLQHMDSNEVLQHMDSNVIQQLFSSNTIVYKYDKILLYEPNQHFSTLNINSDGFRGNEIKDKLDDTYRIFIVGGSTVFGALSSEDSKTIPGWLERQFMDNGLNRIEVINAGINNADSRSEIYLIKHHILNLEPDMIIVYDGWNEGQHDWGLDSEVEDQTIQSNLKNSLDIFLNNFYMSKIKPHYKTPDKLQEIFKNKNLESNEISIPDSTLISTKVSTWEKRWDSVCDLGKEKNFKTIISIQPILGSGEKPLTEIEKERLDNSFERQRVILKVLESMSYSLKTLEQSCDKTIDLRNSFDNVKEPIYYDLGHMSDFGNEIIANKIYEKIIPIVVEDIQNPP